MSRPQQARADDVLAVTLRILLALIFAASLNYCSDLIKLAIALFT